MRVSKRNIDRLKAIYLMNDWDIRVVRSLARSKNFGTAEVVNKHRKAVITVYAKEIESMRGKPEERTTESTMHHEMSETVIASYEGKLPAEIAQHPAFIDFCDDVAEHFSQVVMGVIKGRV